MSSSDGRWRMPARYVFVLMGFLGFNMLYALRVNLSVAMVTMVNASAIDTGNHTTTSSQCFNKTALDLQRAASRTAAGQTGAPPGEFAWDSYTQGVVMGSFFWGYMITQVSDTIDILSIILLCLLVVGSWWSFSRKLGIEATSRLLHLFNITTDHHQPMDSSFTLCCLHVDPSCGRYVRRSGLPVYARNDSSMVAEE